MTEEEAFFIAISAAPEADLPALIYADWLEDRSDPRGELVRVECQLERTSTPGPTRDRLLAEWQRLEPARRAWALALEVIGAHATQFRHGLPEGVSMAPPDFVAHANELFARAPVRSLALVPAPPDWALSEAALWELVDNQRLFRLNCLDLTGMGLTDRAVCLLANCDQFRNLRVLALGGNRIGDHGAEALAASPHLRQLRVLDVSANEIGTEGIRALLRTTRLPHLTALHCQRNPAWTGDTTPPNPRELAARAARSGQQNIGR